jgi:hypothetical protein
MSAKKLDLSKCEVGDRVRLRNGKETLVDENDGSDVPVYAGGCWYRRNGKSYVDVDHLDIVAILPREKTKKPVAKPAAPVKPALPAGVFSVSDLVGKTIAIYGEKNDGTFALRGAELVGVYDNEKAALADIADKDADTFESDGGDTLDDLANWGSDYLIVEVKRVVRPVPVVDVKCEVRVIAGGKEDAR